MEKAGFCDCSSQKVLPKYAKKYLITTILIGHMGRHISYSDLCGECSFYSREFFVHFCLERFFKCSRICSPKFFIFIYYFTEQYEKKTNQKIMPTDEETRQILHSMNNVYQDSDGLYYNFGILECEPDDYTH